METFLIVVAVLAAGWFALLMRRPRAKQVESDGFAADPALTRALDESARDPRQSTWGLA